MSAHALALVEEPTFGVCVIQHGLPAHIPIRPDDTGPRIQPKTRDIQGNVVVVNSAAQLAGTESTACAEFGRKTPRRRAARVFIWIIRWGAIHPCGAVPLGSWA